MKTASFGIKLFLKNGRLKEDGTAPIYARIRIDRSNKMELTTNKWKDCYWWRGCIIGQLLSFDDYIKALFGAIKSPMRHQTDGSAT